MHTPDKEKTSAATSSTAATIGSTALHTFAFQSLGVGAGFVISFVLARSLGPEGRGSLDVAGQTVALLVLLGTWSLGPGLTQISARLRAAPKGLFLLAALLALATAGAVAIVCQTATDPLIKAGLLPATASDELFWRWFIPASITISGLTVATRSVLLGLDRIVALNRLDLCSKLYGIAVFSALAFAGFKHPEPYALTGLVGAGLVFLWLARDLAARGFRDGEWRSVLRPCLAMHFINGLHFLTLRSDIFFVQAQHGAREVGVYTLAVSFGQMVLLASSAVAQPLLVDVSRVGTDHVASGRATARALRGYWLLSGLVALGLAAIAPLLPVVFGQDFAGSVLPLWILLPGVVAFGGLNVITSHLFARDRRNWNVGLALAGALFTLVGNFTLTPRFGAIGAATTSSAGYLVTGFLALIPLRRDAGCAWAELLRIRRGDLRELMLAVLRLRP